MSSLVASTLLNNRYRLGRCLGDGGFGVVYEAVDTVGDEVCAVKMMALASREERVLRRALQEARVTSRLAHPNIVEVFDFGVSLEPRAAYIAMERLRGEDLGRRVERCGSLAPEEALGLLGDAAAALQAAHQAGVLHRDIKPTNLFLARGEAGPRLKVLDFGLAKILAETSGSTTTSTLGTPLYMAPEQFTGEPTTTTVDIFALGLCAFHLLTGRHYYALERDQCTNAFALGARLMRGVPESAVSRAARYQVSLSADFDAWFARATAPQPTERFADPAEAVAALSESLAVAP
ncbi:MAG: serine/threonine-protein kinase, partial [Myxococcota bacterium]